MTARLPTTLGRRSNLPPPLVTPLIELPLREDAPRRIRILGKLESIQPGGSIKDRPVRRMVEKALAEGHLEGRRLLDSSSGNAAIAYAMIGASLHVPVTLVVPGNASRERLDRIRAHGADLILTDPIEGYDFALREARKLAVEQSDLYYHTDQYGNDANWQAHYYGTGMEIVEQATAILGRTPDAFVCGVGTGGTLTGVGRRLREARPDTFLGIAIPEIFPGIEGLKPLGAEADIVPAILDESLIDDRVTVPLDAALDSCRALARAGLFVGPSSGAFHWAAQVFARATGAESLVIPLCDTGERYGSTGLWSN